jgi:16S rRNA (uracil1498-N3)-methyltransferase
MRRFFFDPKDRSGDDVRLSEEESHHIAKVLRLRVGTVVELFDGTGSLYTGSLTLVGRRVEARISGRVVGDEAGTTPVWVYQPILKGEKMDMVVQKCTELGVSGMVPFLSSRCQGKLEPGRAGKKHQRWQRIGLAACKQCLRLQMMQLEKPRLYSELFGAANGCEGDLRLLFWEGEKEVHLQDIPAIREAQLIELMLGPEGGFSPEEVEKARQYRWQTVSLGDRVLRAETATLSAVSIIQYLVGNF